MKKRILSLFLCASMLLGMLPAIILSVTATDSTGGTGENPYAPGIDFSEMPGYGWQILPRTKA